MTLEGIQNYLVTRLPVELDFRQHVRLLRLVFSLVFAVAIVIHLLLRSGTGTLDTVLHATTVASIYALTVCMAAVLLPVLRRSARGFHVWQIWIVSAVGFVLGFYVIPFVELIDWLTDKNLALHGSPLGFVQLLPVWALLTYLFVHPFMSEALQLELERLREINTVLARQKSECAPSVLNTVLFESGRTSFELEADSIRNIAVEDHYCYVHYRNGDRFVKRDVAMPLREILAMLPMEFMQVHRSHIVNVDHVASLRRIGRSLRLVLTGDFEVPVSRHRLDEVLPRLRAHTSRITRPQLS